MAEGGNIIERKKKTNDEIMDLETTSDGRNITEKEEKRPTSSNHEVHTVSERGERNQDGKPNELKSKAYNEPRKVRMSLEEFYKMFVLKDQQMGQMELIKLNTLKGFTFDLNEPKDDMVISSKEDSESSIVYRFKQGIIENRVAEIMACKAFEDGMETLEQENKNKYETHIDKLKQNRRSFEDFIWDEESVNILKELACKKLGIIFKKAIKKLEELGHSEELAIRALLVSTSLNYDAKDLVTNIVENSLKYMKKTPTTGLYSYRRVPLDNLEQLEMCVLDELVSLIWTFHPSMSEAEATWHLLLCDFKYTRALNNICDEKLSARSPLSIQLQSKLDNFKSQVQNRNEIYTFHCSTSGKQVVDQTGPLIVGELTRDRDCGIHIRPIPESFNPEEEVASVSGRDYNKGISKSNTVIRQKSIQVKIIGPHGSNVVSSKQAYNLNKMLDKKLSSGSDPFELSLKDAPLMIKTMGVNVSQAHQTLWNSATPPSANQKPISAPSGSYVGSTGRASKAGSSSNGPASKPLCSSNRHVSKFTNSSSSEVDANIQSTTNEKVMEIADKLRLITKAEGETLRQGKEETLRVQKEKQLKKVKFINKTILGLNNDLEEYGDELEMINKRIQTLTKNNRELNEMIVEARLEAAGSVANSVEASKGEMQNRERIESAEKEKIQIRKALIALGDRRNHLEDKIDDTKYVRCFVEVERKLEMEISAKLQEELMKLTAKENKMKEDRIEKLRNETIMMRLKDSPEEVAALGKSIDGKFWNSSKGGKKKAKQPRK